MYEVISGLPPYHDVAHNKPLALYICQGGRPKFNIKVPQLILHLIKSCLDANPFNRPNVKDLSRIFQEWKNDLKLKYFRNKNYDKPELTKQLEEAVKTNRLSVSSLSSTTNNMHSGAIYTSRLFKFNNLPEPKNSDDYYERYDNISSVEYPGI